ncbi:hypothetical protein H6784_05280 [Candidatus Nomurabacteria bacterium]|nr:hypothetical protein [Candidatus Kaiserbacteria bacterium]MCB9814792.1 hypothetical protein [Candidatus Nomurabacteria bacterium]
MKKIFNNLHTVALNMVVFTLLVFPQLANAQISYSFKNPLAFNSIEDFLVAILNVIIVIAIPIVVFFIIYSGFKYVVARGNPAQIQEASQALTYAIIGGVLIIGAVAISKIISNLVTAFAAP